MLLDILAFWARKEPYSLVCQVWYVKLMNSDEQKPLEKCELLRIVYGLSFELSFMKTFESSRSIWVWNIAINKRECHLTIMPKFPTQLLFNPWVFSLVSKTVWIFPFSNFSRVFFRVKEHFSLCLRISTDHLEILKLKSQTSPPLHNTISPTTPHEFSVGLIVKSHIAKFLK